MSAQTIEQIEMFSEAEMETLQFQLEELEDIQSELIPNLESISLEEVARDLEAYFEEDFEEEAELERGGRRPRKRRAANRRHKRWGFRGRPWGRRRPGGWSRRRSRRRGGRRKRESEKEPLPSTIKGHRYNQAKYILQNAGSGSARASHPKHPPNKSFAVGHGLSLLREAKEDFKRGNNGRLNRAHVTELRKAAHKMSIHNDSKW